MKAAVYSAPGQLDIVERDIPEVEPGWVRLAVTNVGICGSDLHMYRGMLGDVTGRQPGHEVAGIIDATGDGVRVDTGVFVALEPLTSCGHCVQCQTGYYNRCPDMRVLGGSAPGGMAQYMTAPAERLYLFPGEVASHIAALSEPLAVGVRGIRLGGVTLGQSVAVLGAGSIGLLAIPAAFAAGAMEVFITARYPHQADMAQHLGATRVFPSSDALLHEIGDARIDVVIETVGGHADTLQEAATIARAGATIVILGVFDGAPGIPGIMTMRKELRFVGSFAYAQGPRRRDFEITTQLIHQHQNTLEPLVTHRFKLDQVVQAFETAADKATGSIKVQIEP